MSTPSSKSLASSRSLFQIVYVSSAVQPFTVAELMNLLRRARSRNSACGVTGMLLYHDGNFMQLLEGEEADVRETHARIMRDPRHTGCITLVQKSVGARLFSDWSMGFKKVSSEEAEEVEGFSNFLSGNPTHDQAAKMENTALRLLHSFRDRLR